MRLHVLLLLMLMRALATPAWPQTPPAGPCASGPPRIDQTARLEAQQFVHDSGNNQVVARGDAKFYYGAYVLSAEQLVYDQGSNRMIAEGNAQLKDPNGCITRADRFEALDDFRDAFVAAICQRAVARPSLAACSR